MILKEEFSKIQHKQERENTGIPEINENTQRILEEKSKRTGESYLSPSDRSHIAGGNNSSRV